MNDREWDADIAAHVMRLGYDSADGGMWWLSCENPACCQFDKQRHLGQWYVGYTQAQLEDIFAIHVSEALTAVLEPWLAENLTWDAFQSLSDHDLAERIAAALTPYVIARIETEESA